MNILIIGAGYVGSDVAALWSKKGHHVTVTTRHPEKLESLSKVSQKCVILKENDEDSLSQLLVNNDVILVTVAADSPLDYEAAYLNLAHMIRHIALESELIRRLIYTSSTSIYGDHHGLWVDETSELKSKSDQGKILIETEHLYQSLQELGWHVCILRLSEVYGPGRALSDRLRHLQGQTLPGSGDHFTNMIHRADVTAAIDYALRHHLEGIFNLSDDEHLTRHELYDQVAKKFHLSKVSWDPKLNGWHSVNKRVSNHKIKAEGFALRHPHRVLD